ADRGGVDACAVEWKHWIGIEVLHKVAREPRIGGQLFLVHAVADDLAVGDIGRQMADPARHEVEDHAAGWKQLAIERGDRRDRGVVDMRDQPRRRVKTLIRRGVLLEKCRRWKFWQIIHAGFAKGPVAREPDYKWVTIAPCVSASYRTGRTR